MCPGICRQLQPLVDKIRHYFLYIIDILLISSFILFHKIYFILLHELHKACPSCKYQIYPRTLSTFAKPSTHSARTQTTPSTGLNASHCSLPSAQFCTEIDWIEFYMRKYGYVRKVNVSCSRTGKTEHVLKHSLNLLNYTSITKPLHYSN